MVWGVVLAYFCLSGRIIAYLHPAFHVYTAISAGVLLLLAVVLLLTVGGESAVSKGVSLWKQVFASLILVGPLLAATGISPSEFGAAAVENRGLVEHISDLPAFTVPTEPALPTADGSIGPETPIDAASYLKRTETGKIKAETVDLLYAAAEPTMREDFENKDVELIGQFLPMRSGNPTGHRFNLVRMFVMCCAADARPVAVAVQTGDGATFPDMTWVKISGRATFPIESGRRSALIVADSIQEIDAPPETFIY